MTSLTEADVEAAALDWLSGLGWRVAHGPDSAPDTANPERSDYGQVALKWRQSSSCPSRFYTKARMLAGLPTVIA